MAYRLKNRNMQVPNGYKFLQPETGWMAPRMVSFSSVVRSLIAHRRGRPDLITKHGWSTDENEVSSEVEAFNVRICLQHGWTNYLDGADMGGGLPPKSSHPSQQELQQVSVAAGRAKKIWAGVRTLNDWIDSNDPPVASDLAHSRASVCVACPKNTKGDFTTWFTKPAAGAIQQQIERLQDRKLSTPLDNQINVCEICLCPLKLKVHTPLAYIKSHLTDSIFNELRGAPGCWIVSEIENSTT